jgi:hypothetical protein
VISLPSWSGRRTTTTALSSGWSITTSMLPPSSATNSAPEGWSTQRLSTPLRGLAPPAW